MQETGTLKVKNNDNKTRYLYDLPGSKNIKENCFKFK